MSDAALDLRSSVEWAVREHQARIAAEPFDFESYHALFELYDGAGMVDESWCVASVLSFLKKATPRELSCVQRHRTPGLVRAKSSLSDEVLRRHVTHPDENLLVTCILGLIAPAVAGWRAVELPKTLRPEERIGLDDPSLLVRTTKYVRGVLDLTAPELFLRPGDRGDCSLMDIKRAGRLRPTMVVFGDLLSGHTEPELAFALGRLMMDLYAPRFCLVALDRSPQAVKQVLLACLQWVGLPVQGDRAALGQIGREIVGRMPEEARGQLRSLIERLIEQSPRVDIKQWIAASELTAYRVALLLGGNHRIAGRMISQEQPGLGVAGTISPRQKITELVLYGISDDYFAARQSLGIHVGD
ncbi:MAG: hypothetical protein AAGF11_19630 [Myxococcota bacterium]